MRILEMIVRELAEIRIETDTALAAGDPGLNFPGRYAKTPHLLEQCPVVLGVPDKPEARRIFEALREEASFVVDAGIVGTANRFEPSRAKNFGRVPYFPFR
jgi:hypothetical protein